MRKTLYIIGLSFAIISCGSSKPTQKVVAKPKPATTTPAKTTPDQISKLISLSGPTDFYSDHYLKSSYHQKTKGIFQRVVGEKYSPENLESFKKASPLHEVSNVPTLIFQGDRDFLVNRKQGISLDSVMTAKNFPHEFIYMKNSGHVPRFVKKKRENIIFPAILKFIRTE